MYACCLVLHEFLVCYGHLCSWIPLVVWAPRSRNSFSPCIGVPFASGAGEPCKYGYLFHTYPCKDSRSRPSARMGPKHANRLYHLCRPPLLCRRRHVLLFPWSPLGRGSAHGQRGQWLTDSGRRLRRRLQMRHSPQHRRHAAGRRGRSTRAASLDRQMTAIPALCTAGIERALEYVDAPGRGRASASALWQLFRHGGVAAAAARRWLLVLKPGARGNKLGRRWGFSFWAWVKARPNFVFGFGFGLGFEFGVQAQAYAEDGAQSSFNEWPLGMGLRWSPGPCILLKGLMFCSPI